MNLKNVALSLLLLAGTTGAEAVNYSPENVKVSIALKVPGNDARQYPLTMQKLQDNYFDYQLKAGDKLPLSIYQKVEDKEGKQQITVSITAYEDIWFNFAEQIKTGFSHGDCQFYLPGFWYRRNLRSPEKAPSFHTSDSWIVREDRLSTPMTTIFDAKNGKTISVIRLDEFKTDALTTHKEGEVILSGKTSIGYTGFENVSGTAALSFGFPYKEAPKTYIRKLTLAPAVEAFQLLRKDESITLTWEVNEFSATDFSQCVQQAWEYSFDTNCPQPVETAYSPEK